ncbi:MAG TPA: glycosyltransferase family 2 protein [Pyrinomonadaceae bacterium]|nr:glycosyltransferase family 2 protein [Pyrinomonadaceae bacterium]
MPRVSVIIPTYNRPGLLPRAVESARRAGEDVEVIVVDDASVDETAEVCRSLPGIKYLRLERNQGVAGARNVGLLASSADFIAFLDDDDLRLPGTLDSQLREFERDPGLGFVCGPVLCAGQGGELTGEVSAPKHPGGDMFWELLNLDFPVFPLTLVMRKECLFRVGLFERDIPGIDDWDLLVRVAEVYRGAVVTEPVGVYRLATPTSGQGTSALRSHLKLVARGQVGLLDLPRVAAAGRAARRAARRNALNNISDILLWNVYTWLPRGAYRYASSCLLTALRLNPRGVLRPAAFAKGLRKLLKRVDSSQ